MAPGERIEEAVRKDRKLLKLLDRAGVQIKLGSVRVFQEVDVLKSELLRALLGE